MAFHSSSVLAVLLVLLVFTTTTMMVESQQCSQPCCGRLPQGGTGVCNSGQCCSRFNYCGSGGDYCGSGCQRAYGSCYSSAATKTAKVAQNMTSNKDVPWEAASGIMGFGSALLGASQLCLLCLHSRKDMEADAGGEAAESLMSLARRLLPDCSILSMRALLKIRVVPRRS
ncbi:hypothetical protein SELMODRAFT_446133 [Selaginella moellendorffii]|uniref:Chitin-binding type-1 domain-containing protein n=1 Tax=Selaginella moellendorffii TaxID=88036 RepID=D8SNY4_SELML|nr:hypothetical protein SELMODRAFT_446133 [Selaginella moellendorffii]